jgi:thiol:disulfide interchange protein DsbC
MKVILTGAIPLSLMAKDLLPMPTKVNKDIEKQFIQSVIPKTPFKKFKHSVIDGFYTVYLKNGNILYVNPFKKLIIFGQIYTNNGFSITDNEKESWHKELANNIMNNVSAKELIQNSFKMDFNKGSKNNYEFVIFTDPMCPYCKRLEEFLSTKSATIYINFFPLDFHKGAKDISLRILSSKNPNKAFLDYKKDNNSIKSIVVNNLAQKRLKDMISLYKRLNLRGTPTIFVIDKKENKVIELIRGANIKKVKQYL